MRDQGWQSQFHNADRREKGYIVEGRARPVWRKATPLPSLIAGVDFDAGEELQRQLDSFEPAAFVGGPFEVAFAGGSEASSHDGPEASSPAGGLVATVDESAGSRGMGTMVQGVAERPRGIDDLLGGDGGAL
jgi:hypothetical protein